MLTAIDHFARWTGPCAESIKSPCRKKKMCVRRPLIDVRKTLFIVECRDVGFTSASWSRCLRLSNLGHLAELKFPRVWTSSKRRWAEWLTLLLWSKRVNASAYHLWQTFQAVKSSQKTTGNHSSLLKGCECSYTDRKALHTGRSGQCALG